MSDKKTGTKSGAVKKAPVAAKDGKTEGKIAKATSSKGRALASTTAEKKASPLAKSKSSSNPTYHPEELKGVDEKLPELPESYGDNRMVLMPRDPQWLFGYWDLSSEYKEAARSAGGQVLALRLYDVTMIDFDGHNAHAMFEHDCAEWARSWYIPTPKADRDYIVEIGYRGSEQWFPLARSNRVSAPADQPSSWVNDEFVTIRFEEDLQQMRRRLIEEMESHAGPGMLTLFDDGQMRIEVGGPFLNPSGLPTLPLSSAALQMLGISSAAWSGIFSAELAGSVSFIPGSLGQMVPGSLGQMVPGSLGQFPANRLPGSLGQFPGIRGPGPGSIGGKPPEGGYEFDANGTGPATGPGAGKKSGPPLIDAVVELVIHGRSFPGSELSVAGKRIPVGPDGAFSLRISVPEGLRELPIQARLSAADESSIINLRFGRENV